MDSRSPDKVFDIIFDIWYCLKSIKIVALYSSTEL